MQLKTILALALALPIASPALAQAPAANLAPAMMVEWTVANCDAGRVPAMLVGMSSMVIQSAPEADVNRLRLQMRNGIEANYADQAAACEDMLSRIEQSQP